MNQSNEKFPLTTKISNIKSCISDFENTNNYTECEFGIDYNAKDSQDSVQFKDNSKELEVLDGHNPQIQDNAMQNYE